MYLNCHSAFSLKYGLLSPKTLVETAAAYGIERLALADINSTSCAIEFISRCREVGIRPTVGISFWHHGALQFVGLAKNARGWAQLNSLLTAYSCGLEQQAPVPRDLSEAWIIYPCLHKPIEDFRDNEFLGIRPEHAGRLWGKRVLDFRDRLVAWSPATFLSAEDHQAHCILRAIDQNRLITALGPKDVAPPNDYLVSPQEMRRRYASYPFLLENAEQLLAATKIELRPG
ncbi:MAG: PHP domain-containing protein, partial [Bacteroidota bacterium]